jgi:acyl transferase domain-containing protein
MGRELMDTHPVFADTIKAASRCLDRLGAGFSLLDELSRSKADSLVNMAHVSQPACTAVQLALTTLLSSWGINPSMVIGHSSGEIAAAYAAGAITLEDAMVVAYHRGQVASKMKSKRPGSRGAMLAVGAGAAEVKRIIKLAGLLDVTVACENSPNSVTASGDEAAIDRLAAELKTRSLFYRKLRVDVAYHSSHMLPVADEYMDAIRKLTPKAATGNVGFYSSLTGGKLEATMDIFGPRYWADNLTKPVLFSSALQELYTDGKPDTIVEIGPHSALEGPIKQVLKYISQQAAMDVDYLPSLIRNQHATRVTLNLAGKLFINGHTLDFSAVNQTSAGARKPAVISDFAPYPWSHNTYWFESRKSRQHRLKPFARHDLIGTLEDTYSDAEPTWQNVISTDDVPWLKEHRMQSLTTFPLAGYVCIAIEAASQRAQLQGIQLQQIAGFRLREVQASKAFILDDGVRYETLVSLKPYAEGTRSYSNDWDEFRFSSWTPSRGWVEHCRGLVGVKKQSAEAHNPVSSARLQAASVRRKRAASLVGGEIPLDRFYSELDGHGAGYSSVFTIQPGGGLKADAEYSTCAITVHDTASTMPWGHETPSIASANAFMDLAVQLSFAILGAGRGAMPCLFMPSPIKEIEISRALPSQPGSKVWAVVHGCPDFTSPGPVEFFVDAWHATEPQQEPPFKLTGFRMVPVNNGNAGGQSPRALCYGVEWEPLPGVSKAETNHHVTNGQNCYGHANGDVRDAVRDIGRNRRPLHGSGNSPGNDIKYARQADIVFSNSPTDTATKIDSKSHASGEIRHGNGNLAPAATRVNGERYLDEDATNSGASANGASLTRCEPVPRNGDHADNGNSVDGEQIIPRAIEHANGKPKANSEETENGKVESSGQIGGLGDINREREMASVSTMGGASSKEDSKTGKAKSINGAARPMPEETEDNSDNCHLCEMASRSMGNVGDGAVHIITDRDESDPLVSALVELIHLYHASRPSISSLSDVEVSSSARYVCLAELDAPLLRDVTSETFERVKKLLTTCSSILWVTSGAYRFAERPENNLSQGLLRTVRSEIANAAASLDLDPSSKLEVSDTAELILEALDASLATPRDHSPVDFEFVEEGGRLVVPASLSSKR